MVDVEQYFSEKLKLVAESTGVMTEPSSASNDFLAVSRFLAGDDAFSHVDFTTRGDSLSYPLRLNLTSGNYTLDTLVIRSPSDFEILPDWLLDSELPKIFTVPHGGVDSRLVQLAGDRDLPLVMLRSDVPTVELSNLTAKVIKLQNTNSSIDPRDRATLISFSGGWKVSTNSTVLDDWITMDHSPDFEIVMISLATIIALRLLSNLRSWRWLISRLSGLMAFALSLWVGQKSQCMCSGCGCCN